MPFKLADLELPKFDPRYPSAWLSKVQAILDLNEVSYHLKKNILIASLPSSVLEFFQKHLECNFRKDSNGGSLLEQCFEKYNQSLLEYNEKDIPSTFYHRLQCLLIEHNGSLSQMIYYPETYAEFVLKLPETIKHEFLTSTGVSIESYNDNIARIITDYDKNVELIKVLDISDKIAKRLKE